jgi:hypothetical protein
MSWGKGSVSYQEGRGGTRRGYRPGYGGRRDVRRPFLRNWEIEACPCVTLSYPATGTATVMDGYYTREAVFLGAAGQNARVFLRYATLLLCWEISETHLTWI